MRLRGCVRSSATAARRRTAHRGMPRRLRRATAGRRASPWRRPASLAHWFQPPPCRNAASATRRSAHRAHPAPRTPGRSCRAATCRCRSTLPARRGPIARRPRRSRAALAAPGSAAWCPRCPATRRCGTRANPCGAPATPASRRGTLPPPARRDGRPGMPRRVRPAARPGPGAARRSRSIPPTGARRAPHGGWRRVRRARPRRSRRPPAAATPVARAPRRVRYRSRGSRPATGSRPGPGGRGFRASRSSWSSGREGMPPDYSGARVNAIFASRAAVRRRAATPAERPARSTERGGPSTRPASRACVPGAGRC